MHNHDYSTLVDAQQGVRANGYTEEFLWKDGAFLSEDQTVEYAPEDLIIVEHYRFEGMSNPDDMSILLVLKAKDGKKGYAISGYGTYADEKFVSFLDRIPNRDTAIVQPRP